jgi:RimJ/RimL family protein N-acetyltransferase
VRVNLEVFTHNERAQRAYARVGFYETGRHVEWVARHRREINVIEMSLERASWHPSGESSGASG